MCVCNGMFISGGIHVCTDFCFVCLFVCFGSDCNVPKLCLHLKAVAHQSKVLASFAMDAFITACSKGSTW